jgi:hypothetical protein
MRHARTKAEVQADAAAAAWLAAILARGERAQSEAAPPAAQSIQTRSQKVK